MKSKLPILFLILSIPIVLGMTQVASKDTPLTLLIFVSSVSLLLNLKPVKLLTDVLFYFLFEVSTFLAIYFYSNIFFKALFLKMDINASDFLYLGLTFYLSAFVAFILSLGLIVIYHEYRDQKKRAFEISFSAAIALVSTINILAQ